MSSKIPFIILESCPDYKAPYINKISGSCFEKEISYYFVNKVCEFIFHRINYININTVKDITDFWNSYYDDYEVHVVNPPWEASIFMHNNWKNITPSDDEIFERIVKLKIWEKEEIKDELDEQDELTEEEKNDLYEKEDDLIINKIKEFIEADTDQSEEDKAESIISIINQLITNTHNEKNNEKTEELQDFFKIIESGVEKDIEQITKDLEIQHTDENSQKLAHNIEKYGNLLECKKKLKF